MTVYGLSDIKTKTFKELLPGDAFCPYKLIGADGHKVLLLKCNSINGYNAVSFTTGEVRKFEDGEPVLKVNAYVQVKDEDKGGT